MQPNLEPYTSQFAGDTCFPDVCRKISRTVCYRRNIGFRTCTKYLQNLRPHPDNLNINESSCCSNSNSVIIFINEEKNIKPATDSNRFGAFDYLVKNQMMEQKIKILMDSGRAQKKMTSRIYRISVLNTGLTAIGIPILVWLIMETFFK